MLKSCPTGKKYRVSRYFLFSPESRKQANFYLGVGPAGGNREKKIGGPSPGKINFERHSPGKK